MTRSSVQSAREHVKTMTATPTATLTAAAKLEPKRKITKSNVNKKRFTLPLVCQSSPSLSIFLFLLLFPLLVIGWPMRLNGQLLLLNCIIIECLLAHTLCRCLCMCVCVGTCDAFCFCRSRFFMTFNHFMYVCVCIENAKQIVL